MKTCRMSVKMLLLSGMAVLALSFVSSARADTLIKIAFKHGDSWAVHEPVTLFFSTGSLSGQTDDHGEVSFVVQDGKGFWIEIGGQRLAKVYEIGSVPAVIDIDGTGKTHWPGGTQQ